MDNSGEIKIRALPRGNEDSKEKPKAPAKPTRWIVYVAIAAVSLGVFTFFSKQKTVLQPKAKFIGKSELASTNARINESVSRHLQDAEIQSEMMKRVRELENAPYKNVQAEIDDEGSESLPDNSSYGVQMDSDNSAERVYKDLNDTPTPLYADSLPSDKINARIADRKWINEMERTERINFISNFIRSAYDRGYEVEIDANLVVVGVKKINRNKVLDINQVIDRLAKGQTPGHG